MRSILNKYIKNDLLLKVKKFLGLKRFEHTCGVIKVSYLLAKKYKANIKKTLLAALFHDIAKNLKSLKLQKIIKNNFNLKKIPSVWHSFVGEILAKKYFKIKDKEILNAIKYHSTANIKMRKIDKIIFVADYIEPRRKYKSSILIRKKINKNYKLDELVMMVLEEKLAYLILNKKEIFIPTIHLWNNMNLSDKM